MVEGLKYKSLLTLTVSSSSVFTFGSRLILSLLFRSFISSWLFLLLLLLGLSRLAISSITSGSSLLASSGIFLGNLMSFDLNISAKLVSKVISESLLDHFVSFSIDSDLNKATITLSVLISDYFGTQSNLLSLSSS